jgi:hypothetical protein
MLNCVYWEVGRSANRTSAVDIAELQTVGFDEENDLHLCGLILMERNIHASRSICIRCTG